MRKIIFTVFTIFMIQSLIAQADIIKIDGKGQLIDDVLFDIILDQNNYDNKIIGVDNVLYSNFGFEARKVNFAWCSEWFKDNETYLLNRTNSMYDNSFNIYFHPIPTNQDGRKFALSLKGKYYTAPKLVSLKGKFIVHKINFGPTILLYMVDTISINDTNYSGTIPTQISTQWG